MQEEQQFRKSYLKHLEEASKLAASRQEIQALKEERGNNEDWDENKQALWDQYRQERRLDSLARLLRSGECAAVAYYDNQLVISANELHSNSQKINKHIKHIDQVMEHLCNIANNGPDYASLADLIDTRTAILKDVCTTVMMTNTTIRNGKKALENAEGSDIHNIVETYIRECLDARYSDAQTSVMDWRSSHIPKKMEGNSEEAKESRQIYEEAMEKLGEGKQVKKQIIKLVAREARDLIKLEHALYGDEEDLKALPKEVREAIESHDSENFKDEKIKGKRINKEGTTRLLLTEEAGKKQKGLVHTVHAEIQLLRDLVEYLDKEGHESDESFESFYIGISKLCCASCHAVISGAMIEVMINDVPVVINLKARGNSPNTYGWAHNEGIINDDRLLKALLGKEAYKIYIKFPKLRDKFLEIISSSDIRDYGVKGNKGLSKTSSSDEANRTMDQIQVRRQSFESSDEPSIKLEFSSSSSGEFFRNLPPERKNNHSVSFFESLPPDRDTSSSDALSDELYFDSLGYNSKEVDPELEDLFGRIERLKSSMLNSDQGAKTLEVFWGNALPALLELDSSHQIEIGQYEDFIATAAESTFEMLLEGAPISSEMRNGIKALKEFEPEIYEKLQDIKHTCQLLDKFRNLTEQASKENWERFAMEWKGTKEFFSKLPKKFDELLDNQLYFLSRHCRVLSMTQENIESKTFLCGENFGILTLVEIKSEPTAFKSMHKFSLGWTQMSSMQGRNNEELEKKAEQMFKELLADNKLDSSSDPEFGSSENSDKQGYSSSSY